MRRAFVGKCSPPLIIEREMQTAGYIGRIELIWRVLVALAEAQPMHRKNPWILCLLLSAEACGGEPQPQAASTASTASASADAARQLQRMVINDIAIEANVIRTQDLDASVTQRYGIQRKDDTAMLLLTVRGPDGNAVLADGLQLQARVGDLQNVPQPLPLRRLHVDGYIDYVATIPIKTSSTLRLEVNARQGNARATMRFTRDFAPN